MKLFSNDDIRNSMNELLNRIANPDISEYQHEIDVEGGDKVVDNSMLVKLQDSKKGLTAITLKDPDLIAGYKTFQMATAMESASGYAKAAGLCRMKKGEKALTAAGFKTVGDFASHAFGIGTNFANKLARVGEYWIRDNGNTILEFPAGTPVSTMAECLPYVTDDKGDLVVGRVAKWYAEGTLVPGMSQNKVDKKLKEVYKPALQEGKEGKEGKQEGKQESKQEGKQENKSTVSYDAIAEMTMEQASAAMLGNLQSIDDIVKSHITDSELLAMVSELTDALRKFARSMVADIQEGKQGNE